MKIKSEGYYRNEYAKEQELNALKKQYPAMFKNNRATQIYNFNVPSDGPLSQSSSDSIQDGGELARNKSNISSEKDIYKIMGHQSQSRIAKRQTQTQ